MRGYDNCGSPLRCCKMIPTAKGSLSQWLLQTMPTHIRRSLAHITASYDPLITARTLERHFGFQSDCSERTSIFSRFRSGWIIRREYFSLRSRSTKNGTTWCGNPSGDPRNREDVADCNCDYANLLSSRNPGWSIEVTVQCPCLTYRRYYRASQLLWLPLCWLRPTILNRYVNRRPHCKRKQ